VTALVVAIWGLAVALLIFCATIVWLWRATRPMRELNAREATLQAPIRPLDQWREEKTTTTTPAPAPAPSQDNRKARRHSRRPR